MTPLGEALLQTARPTPPGPQPRDGFRGEQAERPSAVGDDLEAGVELVEAGLEVLEGERARAGDVAGRVLLLGPHVEHDDLTGLHAGEQLVPADPLGARGVGAERAEDLVDLGEARPGEVVEGANEAADLLARGAVVDACPLTAGLDEASLAHHLEVRRGRRELEARRRRKRLHTALGLAEQVEQLDALGVHDHLADRYDAWYDTAAGRVLFDLELAALGPLLTGTACPRLEVGVGSGRFAAALGVEVGIDPAEAPLRLASSRGVLVVRGSGRALPFPDGCFGAVVLVVTLCFADDPAGVLAEAARVLRPGGRLDLGLVPSDSAWGRSYAEKGRAGHPFYRHARLLSIDVHRRMLVAAGFKIVESRSTLMQAPSDTPVAESVRRGVASGAGFVALAGLKSDAQAKGP